MITKTKWIQIVKSLAQEMEKKGTIYGWKSPVNEANSLKKTTCVGFVALAMQRAGLMATGKYINFQDTGNLHGTGAAYIKARPGVFQIIENVNKSPQTAGLQVGDIVGYKSHIMIFAGWDSKKRPLWYSLERSSGGVGKKARLDVAERFPYYDTRKINGGIVRIKFAAETKKPTATTNTSTADKKPATAVKYKLKMGMNIRKTASAKAAKLGYAPQGAVITQSAKSGDWVKTTYCGVTGWINCASRYASKV